MLGPLPTLYRVVVATCAVLACVGVGAWVAGTLPGPLLAGAGAGIGAGFGAVAALLLTHRFGHDGTPHRVHLRGHSPRHRRG